MSAMSEIRANYEHCIEAAQQTSNLDERANWLNLAEAWKLLAS